MGTRADFYVGRGAAAEWIGSVAWDGYPSGFAKLTIFAETNEANYRAAVARMLSTRDDATFPDAGWPWPWEDSGTTDYAYAFDDGKVWASSFGGEWFDPLAGEPDESPEDDGAKVPFPKMDTSRAARVGSAQSGVMVFRIPRGSV